MNTLGDVKYENGNQYVYHECPRCKHEYWVRRYLANKQIACSKCRGLRHGHSSRVAKTPTYNSWCAMIDRCTNERADNYSRYGGKGITVDPDWFIFEHFMRDMGERPKGTTLDRKNSAGSYCKDNCQWATPQQQMSNIKTNRKITYNGDTKCLAEWLRCFDAGPGTFHHWVKKGYSDVDALYRVQHRKRRV